jgi:vacuolar-type H+-ATPase subunit F/Vma7
MLGLVIGDNDMVNGFRLVGVEGTETTSVNQAQDALERALTRNDLAVIIISEEFSSQPQLQKIIDKVRKERLSPLVVEVPGSRRKPRQVRLSDLISTTLGVRM